MKKTYILSIGSLLAFGTFFLSSCGGNSNSPIKTNTTALTEHLDSQIGDYVVETFEDAEENLWFGTLEKGAAKYDGTTLTYFTTKEGLPSNRVVSILEDATGNTWFGTGSGLSKYDGKTFTNFTTEHGLCDASISTLLLDSTGNLWVGSWGGVCKFDGEKFTEFLLPTPNITTQLNEDTKNWVTVLMEDSKGNIWFGRDGYGACKYDGNTFFHYLKEDGLYSNNIQAIAEDSYGNILFGSRVAEKDNPDPTKRLGKGGVTKYDGKEFLHFPEIQGLNESDVYEIYKDTENNLWIGTVSNGVYKFDGKEFTNYAVPKSAVSILQDRKRNIWIGCAGGLFCLNRSEIVNVTTNGPWN